MSILMKHLLNLQPCVITRCLRVSPSMLSVNVDDKQEAAFDVMRLSEDAHTSAVGAELRVAAFA